MFICVEQASCYIFTLCVHLHGHVSLGPQVPGRQGQSLSKSLFILSMAPWPNKCLIWQLKVDGDDVIKWACAWQKISPCPGTPKSWRALLLVLVELGISVQPCYPEILLLELLHVFQQLLLLLFPLLRKQRSLLLVLFHLLHNVPSSSGGNRASVLEIKGLQPSTNP